MDSGLLLKFIGYFPAYLSLLSRTLFCFFWTTLVETAVYDNAAILSSMWYVLRFEHAHVLKTYNDFHDRRMIRGQTTRSLGGTANGLLLPYFVHTFFLLCPFTICGYASYTFGAFKLQ